MCKLSLLRARFVIVFRVRHSSTPNWNNKCYTTINNQLKVSKNCSENVWDWTQGGLGLKKKCGKSLRRHWDAAAAACFNDEPFLPPFFTAHFIHPSFLRLSLLLLQLLFFTSLVLRDGGNHPLPSSGTLTPLWLIIPRESFAKHISSSSSVSAWDELMGMALGTHRFFGRSAGRCGDGR